ncbi:MAG: glycosyltransferase family 1 protein [Geobacteraceae bacterium]|nr:glycosyltransferase family 1 protein [Geobacteraceae bacterium]NTW79765.1 glycosyltransferase family 1 protein [Geobacteraceae bacterium]
MITNRVIVVFSDDWGRHPSSCQHLVSQLLPTNRIVWVNTIGMRSPQISLYDIKRCFEIIISWLLPSQKHEQVQLPQDLNVISPIIIPYNGLSIVRKFNRFSVRKKICSIMKEYGMADPIVITTFPCTCDYVGMFNETIHVYYCVDDFVNWPGVDLSLISSMEDDLIKKSNVVFATAEALCDAKTRNGKRPLLLAHGVDFNHFNSAVGVKERPDEFLKITWPIIGFFGALSAWLDYELIVKLAVERPEWSFVFIGPVDSDISALNGVTNIHLLGKIPYQQLPRYAACFDVGIIPFQVNELTKSVNPLKLLEYLSLGLPVVSSFMPEVVKYAEYIDIPRSLNEFLECIDNAIDCDSEELRNKRIEFARNHSWSSVAERFSSTLLEGKIAGLNSEIRTTGTF